MFVTIHSNKMSSELISEQILKFYTDELGKSKTEDGDYFFQDKSANFTKIYDSLLNSIIKSTTLSFQELSYDDYLHCYEALKPVFRHSLEIVNGTQFEKLNLKWMGNNSVYLMGIASMETVQTDNFEKVLLLTSMLEYSLGSVFYTLTDRRTPPHLLRDLLCTEELNDFFGNEAIIFLKILLGTPNSINLRNIVWHGFPKPKDICSYYVTILLLTAHTFGNILERKELVLNYRAQVKDFEKFIKKIIVDLPETEIKPTDIEMIINNSSLIDDDYKLYWNRLVSLLEYEKYWNLILLILPQIELILRILYSRINDFDVSAKLDEYYIIMDTIFEHKVPRTIATECDNNKLIGSESNLNQGVLKLLYDLFIAPSGLRLRDKVSHGEVELNAIDNKWICQILLYLSLHLISGNNMRFPLSHYESKFHLNCQTKNALKEFKLALNKLLATGQLATKCCKEIKEEQVKIFLRPKKESVYMSLMLKISILLTKTCHNYEKSIASSRALLAHHELRSRRRRTLMCLLDSMPKIYDCLHSVLDCLLNISQKLQEIDFENDIEMGEKHLRFLKHCLKISENFVKYSNEDSNEWIKAIELCSAFVTLREKHFVLAN